MTEFTIANIDESIDDISLEIEERCRKLVYHIRWQLDIDQFDIAMANAKHITNKTGAHVSWNRMFSELHEKIVKYHKAPSWWSSSLVGTDPDKLFVKIFKKVWREMGRKPSLRANRTIE